MSTMDLIKSETLAPTLAFRFRMLARKKTYVSVLKGTNEIFI